MPTSIELVDAIRSALQPLGASYSDAGQRDKHYGVWLFALVVDSARTAGLTVTLHGLDGGRAVFRGNPSDLGGRYTHAGVRGVQRLWQVHVDVNAVGASGARHGVDVSVAPARGVGPRLLRLGTLGLGLEAKCFGGDRLDPGHGRLTVGFQREVGGSFWLVSNRDRASVDQMLNGPAHPTSFFGAARPGNEQERRMRRLLAAQLDR